MPLSCVVVPTLISICFLVLLIYEEIAGKGLQTRADE